MINESLTNYQALQEVQNKTIELLRASDEESEIQHSLIRKQEATIQQIIRVSDNLNTSLNIYEQKLKRSKIMAVGVGVGGLIIGATLGVLLK